MTISPNLVHAMDAQFINAIQLGEFRDISDVGYTSFLELEAQRKREEELQRFESLLERIIFND